MSLMTQCKRVLKPTGSLWCNIGDTYATSSGGTISCENGSTSMNPKRGKQERAIQLGTTAKDAQNSKTHQGVPHKSMLGIPERYMIAMIDDGWTLRSKMIWHKRSAMPESVKDRLSRRYEPVYFFVKKPKGYYFDLDSIRVPSQDISPRAFNVRVRDVDKTSSQSKLGYFATEGEKELYNKRGERKYEAQIDKSDLTDNEKNKALNAVEQARQDQASGKIEGFRLMLRGDRRKSNTPARGGRDTALEKDGYWIMTWGERKTLNVPGQAPQGVHKDREARKQDRLKAENPNYVRYDWDDIQRTHPNGKNPGDIISTEWEPYQAPHGAHKDREPRTKTEKVRAENKGNTNGLYADGGLGCHINGKNPGDILSLSPEPLPYDHFAAFPTALPKFCIQASCPPRGLVLDPFAGSGSTLVAAKSLGRRYIGIEINTSYVDIIRDRLSHTLSPLGAYHDA